MIILISHFTSYNLLRRSIDSFLCGGVRMDSGHESLNNTKLVIDNLSQGSQTVGRAGCVRDDLLVWEYRGITNHHCNVNW